MEFAWSFNGVFNDLFIFTILRDVKERWVEGMGWMIILVSVCVRFVLIVDLPLFFLLSRLF